MQFALSSPAFVARLFSSPARPRVTRWFAAHLRDGALREIAPQGGRMTVHCRQGQAWITHDGDPKDVVLEARQSYTVDRDRTLTLYAMAGDCVLEIEVNEPR